MEGEYDELVSYLTPREETDSMKRYQNTTAIPCPVCEKPFADLVVVTGETTSLELSEPLDLCVTRTSEDRPMLFTHTG
jgi:hypothetical protein